MKSNIVVILIEGHKTNKINILLLISTAVIILTNVYYILDCITNLVEKSVLEKSKPLFY